MGHSSARIEVVPSNKNVANNNSILTSGKALPYIKVNVNGVAANALVDTGATVSVIDDGFRQSHRALKVIPLVETHLTVYSPTGDILPVTGFVELNLSIGKGSYLGKFLVVKGMRQKLIIGCNFMAEFNVSVSIGSEQVVFQNGEEIPFISKAKAIPGVCNMFVNKSVDICPNSECIIPVALVENLPENIDVIFEPLDLKECIGVTPARVITTVRNGKACVLVMNVSDFNNHLPEGTRLGHGYVIAGDPEDLYSLVDDGEPEVEPPYPAKGDDNPLQFDLSETDLTTDEVHEAKALLEEFSDIFSKNNADFGGTDVVSHAIKTGDTPPPPCKTTSI